MDPFVSIITINYNQPKVTSELLHSLKGVNDVCHEVIVVDNGSEVNPEASFSNDFPDVRYIRSNKNLGYAGGNNLGIRSARGQFILIINNDVEVETDILTKMLEPFRRFRHVGIVSPKIKYFTQPDIIQYAGFNKINALTGRNSAVGSRIRDAGQFDHLCETHYAHGSAMMISREAIEKVGLLPEHFFLFYEELDYSEQVKKAGFKIIFQPNTTVLHKVATSIASDSPTRTYYMNRNRILFMRRNFNYFYKAFFMLFYIFISFPRHAFKYLISNKLVNFKALLRAIIWNVMHKKGAPRLTLDQ